MRERPCPCRICGRTTWNDNATCDHTHTISGPHHPDTGHSLTGGPTRHQPARSAEHAP